VTALPRGWAEAAVEELGEWRGGGTPSKARDTFWRNGTIPWVSPKDMKRNFIDDTEDHITEHAVRGSATNLIPAQSVLLVTRSGILQHSLPIAINTREVAINQDLKALTPHNGIDAEFVAGQFRADAQAILADCAKAGTTVDSVDFTRLKNRGFRLAPLDEQRRIVAKLNRLLARTSSARADLERIPILIAKYKEVLLAAAFSGELTREWRDAEGLPEAEHVPLGTLVTEIRYGTTQKCYPEPEGIAVLRIPNVSSGRIDLADLKYTNLKPREFDRLRLAAGDMFRSCPCA
jgi:type I restriction enzyme, S subunit